jgi:dsDNA-specific endonuclease/ATPase MutS2
MLNLEDLWIGDLVVIISSQRVGKFEGIHASGKARINSNGKIYLASAKNLEIFEEKEEQVVLSFEDDNKIKTSIADSIDLHIEVLKPDLVTHLPERIFDYQMKAFESFLTHAKSSHKNQFTIIHGKGTGVLRQSVMNYIKTDKAIRFYEIINDGGAVRIHL